MWMAIGTGTRRPTTQDTGLESPLPDTVSRRAANGTPQGAGVERYAANFSFAQLGGTSGGDPIEVSEVVIYDSETAGTAYARYVFPTERVTEGNSITISCTVRHTV